MGVTHVLNVPAWTVEPFELLSRKASYDIPHVMTITVRVTH
jgi:hypothetical protein